MDKPLIGIRFEFPSVEGEEHVGILTGVEYYWGRVPQEIDDAMTDFALFFEGKLLAPEKDIFQDGDTISYFSEKGYRKFRKRIAQFKLLMEQYHIPITSIRTEIDRSKILYQDPLQYILRRN